LSSYPPTFIKFCPLQRWYDDSDGAFYDYVDDNDYFDDDGNDDVDDGDDVGDDESVDDEMIR
jgi:hypothetical protein